MRTHTMLYIAIPMIAMSFATACGEDMTSTVGNEPTVVEKKVFVCADKSRTDDPDTCPAGPVETVTVFVCVDGREVAESDECTEICREGWAWDEYAQQCRKYCPEGQYATSGGIICGGGGGICGGGGNTVECKTIPTCESWQLLDPRTMTCVWPPRPTVVMTQAGWFQRTANPGDQATFAELKAWGTGDVEINRISMQIFVSDMRGNAMYPDAGGLVDLSRPCTVSEWGSSYQFSGLPYVERDGMVSTHVDLVGSGVSVSTQGRTFYVACTIRADIPVPAEGVRLIGVLEGFYSRATGAGDAHGWMWEQNPQLGQYAVILPRPPPCGTPTITLASGSPSGAAIPGFSEVLRFNVTVPSCGDFVVQGVQLRVATIDNAGSGWNTSQWLNAFEWRLYDLLDLSQDIPAGHWTLNADGGLATPEDVVEQVHLYPDIEIGAGQTKTFSVKVDTSRASASQDDGIRVDVLSFCYREVGQMAGICTEGTPIVWGGTLVF